MVGEVPVLSEMQELREIRKLEIMIRQRKEQVERLRQAALLLGAPSPNPDRVQTSGNGTLMEDAVIRMVEIEKQVQNLIEQLEAKRAHIIEKIQKMEDLRDVDVLYKRYVDGKSHRVIAKEMSISEAYVTNLLHKAIEAYKKL